MEERESFFTSHTKSPFDPLVYNLATLIPSGRAPVPADFIRFGQKDFFKKNK